MYLSHQVQNATLVLPEQNRPGISYPKLYPRQPMELQEKQGKVCGGTLALGLSLHCQTPPAKPESVCHPSPGTGHPKLQRSLPPTALLAPALSVGNDRKLFTPSSLACLHRLPRLPFPKQRGETKLKKKKCFHFLKSLFIPQMTFVAW